MGDLGQRLPLLSAGGLLSAARGCLLRGQGSFQLGLVFCGVLILHCFLRCSDSRGIAK